MKIKFKKESLINAVNIALRAVSTKTTMPILECILITANEQVSFSSNDTELGIITTLQADSCVVEESGEIAVEARLFSDIIRKMSADNDADIMISSEGNIINITDGSSMFRIQSKDAEQFPAVREINHNNYISLSQFTLKEVIRNTIFSISANDSNKLMTGELFEVNGNKLKVVSLDGHRISIRNVELKDNYGFFKAIVPGKTLNEISKIISGEASKNVDIYFADNYIMFKFDDTVMVSRLIDGEYFKIDSMLSSDYEVKTIVNKKDILDNIEKSTILIREVDKKPVIINVIDNYMEFKMHSVVGSLDSKISAQKNGKDIMIAFNPKFLLDVLRVIDDEEINIYMTNPKAPCFIRDDEGKYIYLILPVNFNPATY